MFPLMSDAELDDLTEDIKVNKLRDPIKLYDGKILEGRNRYTALLAADLPIPYEVFTGTEADALAYVISKNIHRRHLTAEKKAHYQTTVWSIVNVPRISSPPYG
jgi:hypothetical protein